MGNKIYIYGLKCPKDKIVKYVGKSRNINNRHYSHVSAIKNGTIYNIYLYYWVRDLLEEGLQPELEILDECDVEDGARIEREWINKLKSNNLLNIIRYNEDGCVENIENGEEPKRQQISFRLDRYYLDKIKKECKKEEITISTKLNQIIFDYFYGEGKGDYNAKIDVINTKLDAIYNYLLKNNSTSEKESFPFKEEKEEHEVTSEKDEDILSVFQPKSDKLRQALRADGKDVYLCSREFKKWKCGEKYDESFEKYFSMAEEVYKEGKDSTFAFKTLTEDQVKKGEFIPYERKRYE